jgi:radical SAM protein with 4Fe4S-binding SPASM domain
VSGHKTIYVKTTGTCNLDCQHCFTNGKNGDKTQFDPDVTAAWVEDFMSKYPVGTTYHMEFHGGEPFLVPLEKLKRYADKFVDNEYVSMCANSNLTFKITPEHIAFIKDYLGETVGTSWDHWIRWSNQKQFDLWKSNLELLRSHGIYIALKVSVSRELIANTPDWFIDQMESFAVDDVALERLTVDGNAKVNMSIFPDNEAQDNWYLALYHRYKERNPSFRIKTLDVIEEKLKNNMVKVDTNCRNCEQNLVTINSDGSLSGCPNSAARLHHAKVADGVEVFLNSDGRVDQITKELTWNDPCLSCDVFDLCGGDCHRLPWQEGRCGGLKNTLRFLSGRNQQSNLILKV